MSAVLVWPADRSDEWLAARRDGISASEIAAVLGISPYESAFSLYWRKVNGWMVEENREMRAGRILEDAIADWWFDEHDPLENLLPGEPGLYAHQERPWQLATPDVTLYWSESGRAVAVLECKYEAHSWDGYGDVGTDQIPVHFRAQVQWQCDVMEVEDWYLAALGPGGFRGYQGRRDERDLRVMRAAGERFMARLAAGDPPPIDDGHPATIDALKRLHPSIEDRDVEVDVSLAEGYRRARVLRLRAERLTDRYEARLRDALGGARRAVCNGQLVASRTVFDQSGDTAELKAIDEAWPVVDRLNPGRAHSYV